MYGDPVRVAAELIATARAEGRTALLEPEGFQLLDAVGLQLPRRLFVKNPGDLGALSSSLKTPRVVVKVVSPAILHKSDHGGVVVVTNEREAIGAAMRQMAERLPTEDVSGYSIAECIPFDGSLGGEWLIGMRWTDEFGPVITVGAGGIATEFLASVLQAGRDAVVFSPRHLSRVRIEEGLGRLAVTALATGQVRRQPPRTTLDALANLIERFSRLAPACRPDALVEIEINPLVAATDGLVALDVLATIGDQPLQPAPPRPIRKIRNLLQPRTVAVMGVSASQMNPGRVILRNLLREGFDPASIHVVKPGVDQIDGCRAVAGIRLLPAPVDLLILSVSAAQVPEALIEVSDARRAESVIVIPGGFDEKSGTAGIVSQMRETLVESRRTDWGGAVVNGGNCLGITSRPGQYDTMFIPPQKLGRADGPESPLAIVAQSGAFAVSRETRLRGIRPRYTITVGNQMDLTIGDFLRYLEWDPALRVFALYVEGFRPLDGTVTLDAIERITSDGRPVIVYRAGRTSAGRRATASHTAAVAGDYAVSRDLLRAAGATVAESLDDFTDLVMLFTLLHDRPMPGRRIGAMSNAGYECVAIADNLGALRLEPFTARTTSHLEALLDHNRLGTIVDVGNPFDVTPMLGDQGFAEVARAIIEDAHVDVGVIGCVPATPALTTLAAHGEDLDAPGSLPSRLKDLGRTTDKPFVTIIDAGGPYDPLATRLLEAGIPTFRSADRALRLLNVFVESRYRDTIRAESERWVDEFSVP